MTTAQPEQSLPLSELMSVAQTFVPLCSLKTNYLEFLLREQASVEYLYAGQVLVKRGDSDSRHIYLLSGRICLEFASGRRELIDAVDSFYPIANEMPRPCGVVAAADSIVLIIESERLDRMISWSQVSQYLLSELSLKRDFDEDISWIETVLKSNLFYKVPPINAEQIFGRMQTKVVKKGEVIIREGEVGHCCYFIKEGRASVYRRKGKANEHIVDIGVGRCFGEDALVFEAVRNASIEMDTDGVLMCLDKKDFMRLLAEPSVKSYSESEPSPFSGPMVFLDVRTLEEYEQGHLAMSANVPLALLSMKRRLLDASTPYVLYCDTGRRSRSAAHLLFKEGFNVASLQGGLLGAGMQHQLVNDVSYILKDGQVIKAINK